MPINRRQFLQGSALTLGGLGLSACQMPDALQLEPPLAAWPDETAAADWRLLNRISFGPRPEERRRLQEIGRAAYLEAQLAPETLPPMPLRPRLLLRRLSSLHLDPPELFDMRREQVQRELQQATLLQAIYNPAQLQEVMVDFWHDHFNIDQTKEHCDRLKTIDERDVIRPHALGNFRELLHASAHSPAMLIYLDNQENHAGNPNENYARELLELHTLGVDGGYTQTDVQELARCLTGWTVKRRFYRGQFTFKAKQHDDGAKQVLGLPIPAGAGQAGGEAVLDMLAEHPATATFIATKLVRRFVADVPPPALVTQAAQTFRRSQGDITAVLRSILLSPIFLQGQTEARRKLKRPLDFVVSSLRQLNAQSDGGPALLTALTLLGQPLFQWPTPDGFPDEAAAWQGSLLMRWRFALALVNDDLPGTTINLAALADSLGPADPTTRLQAAATLLLGRPLPQTVATNLLTASPSPRLQLAALLSSPEFQWRGQA